MENLTCEKVQKLLPDYSEGLYGDETSEGIKLHLEECESCRKIAEVLELSEVEKLSKKEIIYFYGIRIWYFLCPFLALILFGAGLDSALRVFEIIMILSAGFCVLGQYFSASKYHFEKEQYMKDIENRKMSKKRWGKLYTSPIMLGLPPLLTAMAIYLIK